MMPPVSSRHVYHPTHPPNATSVFFLFGSLGLLLGRGLSLSCLLLVAVDHHNSYERANHGGTEQSKENGDTDGPDTGREEIVERVTRVDEGLAETNISRCCRKAIISRCEDVPSTKSRWCSRERSQ